MLGTTTARHIFIPMTSPTPRTVAAQRVTFTPERVSWESLSAAQLSAYEREARKELRTSCAELQMTHYSAVPRLDGTVSRRPPAAATQL